MNTKDQYDIAIIGAGIVGSALAYKLSQYSARVLLLDRAEDVGCGATKANSGIVHGGYAAKHGSLKAELSLAGNRQYDQLSRELGFPFRRCGSYVLAFDSAEEETLEELRENGRKNGVDDLEILPAAEIASREPRVNPSVTAALFSPGTGIVSPYEAAIAMSEAAAARGTDLLLRSELRNAWRSADTWVLSGEWGEVRTRAVVDAAGLGAGILAGLLGEEAIELRPRKGQYAVFQRGAAAGLNSVIFQTPSAVSKGILVTPTTWGNIMVGPNAENVKDNSDLDTDYETLVQILEVGRKSIPDLDMKKIIRTFSGLRPSAAGGDFVIRRGKIDGVYLAAGIESPGLTAAPAIADMLVSMMSDDGLITRKKTTAGEAAGRAAETGAAAGTTAGTAAAAGTGAGAGSPVRRPITLPGELQNFSEIRNDVTREEGDPQRIVCRCEQVREHTIRDALSRPIPIDSLDALKRRTRAGMGGCQGSFCGPRVSSILKQHLGAQPEAARKSDMELIKKLREL